MSNDIPKWEDTEEIIPSWDDTEEVPVSSLEESNPIEQTLEQYRALAPAAVGVGTTGALEAARRGIGATSGLAEELAFIGAGGRSTPIGKDMLVDAAKNLSSYEPTVTPRKVGREILEEKLLGPGGFGTNLGNVTRASKNLSTKSIPSNQLLSTLEQPIYKQDIANLFNYDIVEKTPDLAVRPQRLLRSAAQETLQNLTGTQTALEAEQSKRDLQKTVNYMDEQSAANSAANKAQARATREAVENAVLKEKGAKALEDFKNLKAKSGAAAVAEDIIEETAKKGMRSPSVISNVSGLVGDIVGKKLPGMAAAGLDVASKIAKSPAAKAVPYLGGALSAGLTASEFSDLKKQGKSTGEAIGEVITGAINPLGTKNMEALAETLRKAKIQNLKAADKYANKPIITEEITPTFDTVLDKAESDARFDKFRGMLDKYKDTPDADKERAMFGLMQQPGFRQLLKKDEE